MRGVSAGRILLLATTAVATLSWGQTTAPPSISTVVPSSVPAGSSTTTLVVNGAGFVFDVELPYLSSAVSLNGVTLPTTFVNSGTLTAAVPADMLISPIVYNVQVVNPGALSNIVTFTVLRPTISSLSPPSIPAGSATFTMIVLGGNFVSGSLVSFDGTALPTSFDGSGTLHATVPAALIASPRVASIVVTNPGGESSGSASLAASFTVTATLAIATISLPSGNVGSTYAVTLTGRGGTPPYTWSASGLPPALSINSATGVIAGVLQAGGTYPIAVVLRDAANFTVNATLPLVVGPAPVSIAPSSSVPSGVVGVAYTGFIFASGGREPYTFSIGSGSLPDGLTLSSGGVVSGTPRTPGQFSFVGVVTDSTGATASRDFRITIQPAPLNITGGPTTPSVPAGTPINISFGGTGGVGPYRFSLSGSLPPGTTFTNGVLSGTPTTAGSFTFRVTLADSTGAVASKDFTLAVVAAPQPPSLSLDAALGGGKVGVPYTGRISAAGGTGPYSYSGSGLPDGLSLSASGSVSGTPVAAGRFPFTATVTDSRGATASGTFPITIAPADLAIVTTSLPDGVVGVAYAASLIASGGVTPYTWTVAGLPDGLTATAAGAISGIPRTAGKFSLVVNVSDAGGTTFARAVSVSLTITPAPLAITTASLPNGTVGTAYSASFIASGGTAPLTFSATGLPAGLSLSAAGAVSGTPTAPGAATIVVTVKDAAGVSISKSFPVTIGLPPTPPLNFAGISNTSGPLQQPRLQVSLGSAYPVDVAVTLTLTFAPDVGPDDPAIQFSSGGRTARITILAGALNGATDAGVQTGSVAGLIAVSAQMQASGQDVTPSPAPRSTIRVAAAAPVIVSGSLTAVRNSAGFTVTLTGYATDRELTQAVFQFTAAAGSNLQTTSLTVPIDALFAPYFSGAQSTPFGSQFTYTQPFTVTGSTQAVASVTVTLVNKIGQSAPATATLN